jgi:hypothetical protein
MPIPESIGRTADEYAAARELRLAMEKEVDIVKKRESELRESIIDRLSKSDDTGAAGLRYRAQIVIKEAVKVADWGVLHAWIRKNDRFDMLQKRINETAAKDWAAEEKRLLPGTEMVKVPDVSITKI